MSGTWISRLLAAVFVAVITSPVTASACTVCMGDPSTKTAGAMNGAIFVMLGFVGFMLCSIVGFAFYLMSRANALAAANVPPQTAIASMIHSEDSK